MSKTLGTRLAKMDPKNKLRNAKILELRIAGASERQIAEEVGMSDTTVHRVIHQIIDDMNRRLDIRANVVKRMELERLDKMTLALFANRNDPRTADSLLRIMERRAKYLGIDAPIKTETVTRQDGPIEVKHDLGKLSDEQLDQLHNLVAVIADDGAKLGDKPDLKARPGSVILKKGGGDGDAGAPES